MALPHRILKVHSISKAPMEVDAVVNGATIKATVQGTVIELVSDDGSQSQTLRFTEHDMPENTEFVEGEYVRATYKKHGGE